jgi:hypothetical protein
MSKKTKATADSAPHALRLLWEEGFFKISKSQEEVETHLAKRGNNFRSNTLFMALLRAKHLIPDKKGLVTKYIQTKPAISKETDKAQTELFENVLIKKFGKSFEIEIADLHHNFGRSGNCTAFMLRKILEKLIYITFAKHQMEAKLQDPSGNGRLVGLEAMINTAAREKVGGIPFLTPHTATDVKGIKFLGDVSAHNPLVDVDMKTIVPQLPYIITAYKELLR